MRERKVVIALNSAWNLYNFRAGLIKALVQEGYEVVAVAPRDDYADLLSTLGCRFQAVDLDSQGTSPRKDIRLLLQYIRLLKNEKPTAFLGFTIKPNVYGSLAAKFTGIPVINNVAGLGFAFTKKNWLTSAATNLYKLALRHSAMVFFQNEQDRSMFLKLGIVKAERSCRIPGSGVDLVRFGTCNAAHPIQERPFRFLLAARLLWEKGVGEFIEAARHLRQTYPEVECCVVGFTAENHAKYVSLAQVRAWETEGVIRYLGISDRIEEELEKAHCVVLPSYYMEGVPRTLLEAAAARRPIITTDWIGCREVVTDQINGLLCRPRDAGHLVEKMTEMLRLTPERRMEMGEQGRLKVEREFSEETVIGMYTALLRHLPSIP
ncbi:glycosyltransferase family 4 protein [Aquabacterium sp.]|uniref:glycosyltransferase family 4 protein n=1 Tax=Aquabacterium sp. TaxID=1872578 RepID=UPI002487D9F4|nr:glycosyltransferase family 4 protein [Aquabacterium sp.]MDI1259385.1 glycosyltransferase family 4 protein [Aquabacterium sp.]